MVDIPGEVDEQGKTIKVELPPGTDVTALEPELEISERAVYEPLGARDFSRPINYTVTAEDGTSRTYLVTVSIALNQKEILLKIAEANPGKLDWKEEDSLSDWTGVTINGQGQVTELDLFAYGLTEIPLEIGKLSRLQNLRLRKMSWRPCPVNSLNSIPCNH